MATSDLLVELQKPAFKPDSDGERKICKCILKLLNDQSSDVQGLAVKWHAHAATAPFAFGLASLDVKLSHAPCSFVQSCSTCAKAS